MLRSALKPSPRLYKNYSLVSGEKHVVAIFTSPSRIVRKRYPAGATAEAARIAFEKLSIPLIQRKPQFKLFPQADLKTTLEEIDVGEGGLIVVATADKIIEKHLFEKDQGITSLQRRLSKLEAEMKVGQKKAEVEMKAVKKKAEVERKKAEVVRKAVKGVVASNKHLIKLLTPIRQCILLDQFKRKIFLYFSCQTWQELKGRKSGRILAKYLHTHFPNPSKLTLADFEYVCSKNITRHKGNIAAHTATKRDIQESIREESPSSPVRKRLEKIYKAVHVQNSN